MYMYKKVLTTLFQWNADDACKHILDVQQRKGFCVVDYLYFANVSGKKLFMNHALWYPIEDFSEALLADYTSMNIHGIYTLYQDAILTADLVLMDGIAFQLFYFLAKRKWLPNLNWTDFCPYFLKYIKEQQSDKKMNIILYWTHPHLLEKTKIFLHTKWYNVIYAQDGYTNLDWENVTLALKWKQQDINVLLVARTTPEYPIQEIWTLANTQKIKTHKLIVMNQWGTFDFWVGAQKRAPKFIRCIKLEWLWRLIITPKRQIKKTLDSLAIFKYIFVYLILKKH